MGTEVKETLRIYSHYIVDILRPSVVLGYMSPWMPESAIEQIKAEEAKGATAAATLFMDKLLTLECTGWYQGFLDGLNAAKYSGLYEALTTNNFANIASLEEPKKLLSLIREKVTYNIKTNEVAHEFTDCLLRREIEEILKETETRGLIAGANKLIDCLLRSDKKNWPKVFTLAMEKQDYKSILEIWNGDPECSNGNKEPTEDSGESALMAVQFSEEPVLEDQCLSAPGDTKQDYNTTLKSLKVDSLLPRSVQTIKLRKYQEELAQPGYSGKNTIICAPTGCGKTFVALSICEHHLESMPRGQRGKVVFMATKVPVYEQQKTIFCQYFDDSGYSVVGFSGEGCDNAPIDMIIEQSDIIILTPQILVNCLKSGYVNSLSVFTLMIFDECHNTIGNHPYNVLMFEYLDLKLGSQSQKLPQIVGLTASVGTGKARCSADAVQYISKLCASLDIEVISTVKQNKEELRKVVHKPEKFIRVITPRKIDPFAEIMFQIMAETEQMAKSVYPYIESMSPIQNRDFGTQKYEQWIIGIQKKCCLLQFEDKMEESRICGALFTYTEHLRKFNDSLMINEDARTKDALDYLHNFFNNIKNGAFTDIEQQLEKMFEANLPLLMEIAKDNENPKLDELQFILLESYHDNPDTRTLLFVKTRALVAVLKKWIEETPSLCFLNPETLIGRNKRHENEGMTLPSQKGALDSFKNSGENKLLIATSVADEGIDIPACNLVLLYEYVGNVTKMIQVKGRGRAQGSKCYLITSKPEQAEREKINLLHERLMNVAVDELQNQDRTAFLKQNLQFQKDEKKFRDFKKNFKGRKLTEENKRLLCTKCKTFACNTDDIRTIQESHHTVIDKSFKDRYFTRPHSKARAFGGFHKRFKIFCNNPKCGEDWGISGNYQTFQDIPLIKIDKFVVENANGSQVYFRKWVQVDFKMKPFTAEEIEESFSTTSE